jgi:hypothetical protein
LEVAADGIDVIGEGFGGEYGDERCHCKFLVVNMRNMRQLNLSEIWWFRVKGKIFEESLTGGSSEAPPAALFGFPRHFYTSPLRFYWTLYVSFNIYSDTISMT